MTTVIILLAVSLLIFAAYTAYAVWRCGIPASLSETFYTLTERGYKGGLFCVALVLAAMFMMPAIIEASDPDTQWMGFLTAAGIGFVGFAPEFCKRLDRRVHYIGTAVSALGIVLWSIFTQQWLWITLCVAIGGIIYPIVRKPGKWLFWLEMALFATAYINVACALIMKW